MPNRQAMHAIIVYLLLYLSLKMKQIYVSCCFQCEHKATYDIVQASVVVLYVRIGLDVDHTGLIKAISDL